MREKPNSHFYVKHSGNHEYPFEIWETGPGGPDSDLSHDMSETLVDALVYWEDKNILVWEQDDYRAEIWFDRFGEYGRIHLLFDFYFKGEKVFESMPFSPAPGTTGNYHAVVENAVFFMSLQPGDTDDEFFEDYTPEQLAFVKEHGEDLSLIAFDLEQEAEMS